MALYVTGDWHGGGDWNHYRLDGWTEGASLSKDDYLVILGDFGLVWTDSYHERAERRWLDDKPWTTLFIDGNHENFDRLYELPVEQWCGGKTSVVPGTSIRWLRRGQVFDIDGCRLFCMGGAWSIDAGYRTPGYDWFEDELPTRDELAEGECNLDAAGWNVDYVLTHDCPYRYLYMVTEDSPFGDVRHMDDLELWLDMVDDRCTFEHWYFGHHHQDRSVDDAHTCVMDEVIRIG